MGDDTDDKPPWYRRRKHLSVYVSPEAYEAFTNYARENGVTVSGLIEQLGRMLAEGFPRVRSTQKTLIDGAKAIDEQRRRRR